MKDTIRESLSYAGLYYKMFRAKKCVRPEKVRFGADKEQYMLLYDPPTRISDKIIVWVHGGGWNAGSPEYFDFVGQCIAGAGYRFVSLGYRLSPKHKYPCQIEDVCMGYQKAMEHLKESGIDVSKVVVCGPSAGAHLASILCYSKKVQQTYAVDVSNVAGFIGAGGPYSFSVKQPWAVNVLLDQLFSKGADRMQGEPCSLMEESGIPMLLIQSEHDGLIPYAAAERFHARAAKLGIPCELYSVVDKKNTHSWYTAGMFLETREENRGLDTFFAWIERLP